MRDRGVGDGIDEFGAILDDAALLIACADHESGDVLSKEDRHTHAIAELDELSALVTLLAKEDAVIGQDPDGVPPDMTPTGDQRRAIERLELLKLTAIEDAREHLARFEGLADVSTGHAEEFIRVVRRLDGCAVGPRTGWAPAQMLHDLASDPQCIRLIKGEIVREARGARMHLSTAQLLFIGILINRHLHQRWTTEIDARGILLQHDVIAHAGHIGTPRGAGSKDEGHGRDARRRELREILETRTTRDKDLRLLREVSTAGLRQADKRQTIGAGDFHGTQAFGHRCRTLRSPLHGRIVGDHHDLGAVHSTNAGDDSSAQGIVRAPAGQWTQLQEGRAAIQQEVDALARQEFAAATVSGDGAGVLVDVGAAATGDDLGEQVIDLTQGVEHGDAIGGRHGRIEAGAQDGRHGLDATVNLTSASSASSWGISPGGVRPGRMGP